VPGWQAEECAKGFLELEQSEQPAQAFPQRTSQWSLLAVELEQAQKRAQVLVPVDSVYQQVSWLDGSEGPESGRSRDPLSREACRFETPFRLPLHLSGASLGHCLARGVPEKAGALNAREWLLELEEERPASGELRTAPAGESEPSAALVTAHGRHSEVNFVDVSTEVVVQTPRLESEPSRSVRLLCG
jgi:hypothetical protein